MYIDAISLLQVAKKEQISKKGEIPG